MRGGVKVDAKKVVQVGFYLFLAGALFLGAIYFAQKA